jgi:glutathione-regulated potassium-efflux system ancillary protein KefC
MANVWAVAALWVGLALVATLVATRVKVSTALLEILAGMGAQFVLAEWWGVDLGARAPWIGFLAGAGAIVLTFLAGAELDPDVFRRRWKEATGIGLVGFAAPFLGVAALARFGLGWSAPASWLAGVALSTTSVAVVYAVLLELGLNRTEYGKAILAACFVNDLGTVVALGLIFSPFTGRTLVFVAAAVAACALLPQASATLIRRYGGHVSELEPKFILFALFVLGGLAVWAETEPVLPAYVVGMVLAESVGRDHALVRRLRAVTFGLLTPFYFIRAGAFVSVPALAAAPLAALVLLVAKLASKGAGLVPSIRAFGYRGREGLYYTLMMSTGLTFGTISALFGLAHGVISPAQYSYLVAAVIGSAVLPTLVANLFFVPAHLLDETAAAVSGPGAGVPRPETAFGPADP